MDMIFRRWGDPSADDIWRGEYGAVPREGEDVLFDHVSGVVRKVIHCPQDKAVIVWVQS